MKKLRYKHFVICVAAGALAVLVSGCSSRENTPEDKTVQKRHLVITMQGGDNEQHTLVSPRRVANATITDEGSRLYTEWTAGDKVSFCNLSRLAVSDENIITGELSAVSSAHRSDLEGDVDCMSNDYLAIVYPAVDMSQSYKSTGDASVHCKFTIPLSGQDGTLERLATNYHYVYGRAHVTSVIEKTATATMDKMQSLLTVCKFSFETKDGGVAIPVKTLSISYGGDGEDKDMYPQSATVDVTNLTSNSEASAVAADITAPLVINCGETEQNEVYVALLPAGSEGSSRTYQFTVTNSEGTYTGTAQAVLYKGKYVVASGLKLTKK